MARYLQVVLLRAENINACTTTRAKASYKNTVYTTTTVKDMGRNPEFEDDGTNVFHFVCESGTEYITLELYRGNAKSIGKSKLCFNELTNLTPEQAPEERVLPVMVTPEKQCGKLFLTVQIKNQPAVGKLGNLTVVLQRGSIPGLISTSLFREKTATVSAKLTYNHTTLTSGILDGAGSIFVWRQNNSFTFIINSSKPEDVLEIKVYNGSTKAGECKIKMSLFTTRADEVTLEVDLLAANKPKAVGSITVSATYICRRENSFPAESSTSTVVQPELYPPPHQATRSHPHTSQVMYTGVIYPPEQHQAQTTTSHSRQPSPDLYAPSAPPAGNPAVHNNPYMQTQAAHGAPPGRVYFERNPEIFDFVNSYH